MNFWFVAFVISFSFSFKEEDLEGFDEALHGTFTGDESLWLRLFHNMDIELIGTGLGLTEGPTWVKDVLLFSSTTQNKIFNWGEENVQWNDHENHHHEVFENSGDCGLSDTRENEENWRGEPGSNGLFFDKSTNRVYICQHCARRVKVMSVSTGKTLDLPGLDAFEGKRFNSPNDVVVHKDHVIFTDPLYGFLEKDRFYDDAYLDTKGDIGVEGIYAVSLSNGTQTRLKVTNRPNGIQVLQNRWEEDILVYSQCCQGVHCAQGTARWYVHELETTGQGFTLLDAPKRFQSVIENTWEGAMGCADGLTRIPTELLGREWEDYFMASCPMGICFVSLKEGLKFKLNFGVRVTNMVFGDDGFLYVTGDDSLWRLETLKHSYVSDHYHGDYPTHLHDEL